MKPDLQKRARLVSPCLFSSQPNKGHIHFTLHVLQKQAAVSGLRCTCFLILRIRRSLLNDAAIKAGCIPSCYWMLSELQRMRN